MQRKLFCIFSVVSLAFKDSHLYSPKLLIFVFLVDFFFCSTGFEFTEIHLPLALKFLFSEIGLSLYSPG